jgi:hypothetical protein
MHSQSPPKKEEEVGTDFVEKKNLQEFGTWVC